MTVLVLGAIIYLKWSLVIIEELLNDMEIELWNIFSLFMALDNAMNHCQDSRLETEHLLILSGYACKRMTKFVKNFDKIEISYYKRCAAQNLQSNLSQEAGK